MADLNFASKRDEVEVGRIFREEFGRSLAALIRVFGDIDVADDALQEAFEVALARWPADGLPPNPGGWITTTARNRAIDRLRRESRGRDLLKEAAMLSPEESSDPAVELVTVEDERLRLIFMCCHPALSQEAQVALTLRLLGGLSTGEVARSFLVAEATMAQRLVRAKRKIRLARVLVALMPDEPEPFGLLALLLLAESRRSSRFASDGSLVLLADQDRSRWNQTLVAEGQAIIARCQIRNQPGPYQLQAAIGAGHAGAATARETDWSQILVLYDQLLVVAPTPVVALNRAVAVGEVQGAAAALALVDDLDLVNYYPFHATRADLLRRLGRDSEAATAYERAAAMAPTRAEREFLKTGGRATRPTAHGV